MRMTDHRQNRINVVGLLVVALVLVQTHAWAPSIHSRSSQQGRNSLTSPRSILKPFIHVGTSTTSLYSAGFGGSGDANKSKDSKLKPKQQWDRYLAFKQETKFRVAVKVANNPDGAWLEVGSVKSQEDKHTAEAVARQRALIVEHARRLFPLQVSPKDRMEWAYSKDDGESWVVVDKAVLDAKTVPDNLDKLIGFEGRPDPSTGYYCVYNEGRIVKGDSDVKGKPSSKRLG